MERGQITASGLPFLNLAGILDGDDGLVSEGLEKLDMAVRERTHL